MRTVTPRLVLRLTTSANIAAALLLLSSVRVNYRYLSLNFCGAILDQFDLNIAVCIHDYSVLDEMFIPYICKYNNLISEIVQKTTQ